MTFTPPEITDRPFAPPLDIVLDLPMPPSVNQIWRYGRGGQVYRSPAYAKWIKQADGYYQTQKINIEPLEMFEADIIILRSYRDLDNSIKCLLDAAQRWRLIQNDKLCERLTVRFGHAGDAPLGARLRLRPYSPNSPTWQEMWSRPFDRPELLG